MLLEVSPMKVNIIGSNFAGLCAACELVERGCPVTIVKTSPRLGGCTSMATNATEGTADVQDVDWLLNFAGCKNDSCAQRSPRQVLPTLIYTLEHFEAARPEKLSIWAGTTEIWILTSDPHIAGMKCQSSGMIQQELGFVILADSVTRIPAHTLVMVCGASDSWLQAFQLAEQQGDRQEWQLDAQHSCLISTWQRRTNRASQAAQSPRCRFL